MEIDRGWINMKVDIIDGWGRPYGINVSRTLCSILVWHIIVVMHVVIWSGLLVIGWHANIMESSGIIVRMLWRESWLHWMRIHKMLVLRRGVTLSFQRLPLWSFLVHRS